MNQRKKSLVKLLTIFVILSNSDRIKNKEKYFTSLHNCLYNLTSLFTYNNNLNERKQIQEAIYNLEKKVLPAGFIISENLLLNMLDQEIENIRFSANKSGKHLSGEKLKTMNKLQELIYNDEQFNNLNNVENLDNADKINQIINELLEEK